MRFAVLAALFLALPVAQAAERTLEATLDDATPVEILNLVGDARLVPGEGDVRVRATVRADDAAIAQAIRLVREDGRVQRLSVEYPEDLDRIRYDGGGYHELHTELRYMDREVRISADRGERVRVDLEITVPAGAAVKLSTAAGEVQAANVDGALALRSRVGAVRVTDGKGSLVADTHSGPVEILGFRGDVEADTGSGTVTVENVLGRVEADTGSGTVQMRGIDGDVVADTGSGAVELRDVSAEAIRADTGSGRVRIEDSSGSLEADTGSGGVRAQGFRAGPRIEVDTGSGSVDIEGDLSAVERLVVDTGSGGVTLTSSAPLSLRLDLETGSGGIRVDVPDLSDVSSSRDHFRATAGSGRGSARVDTGSGGIRITAP